MRKPKVKMLSPGSSDILKNGTRADLKRRAEAVARRAGPGFEARVTVGRTRAMASIVAVTPAAKKAEQNDRVLLKALDAAR